MKLQLMTALTALTLLTGCGGGGGDGGGGGGGGTPTGLTDEEVVSRDLEVLTFNTIKNQNTAEDNIIADLQLINEGENGSSIVWNSSDGSIIDESGDVIRPAFGTLDKNVTLTANISKGDYDRSKTFALTVLASDPTDTEAVAAVLSTLNFSSIAGSNSMEDDIVSDLTLESTGLYSTTITWTSSNTGVIALDGSVVSPSYLDGDQSVILTASVSRGDVVDNKSFSLTVPHLAITADEQTVLDTADLVTFDDIRNANSAENNILTDLTLPATLNSSTLDWSCSDGTIIGTDGVVYRPDFSDGNMDVNLTVMITKNSTVYEKTFLLTVIKLSESDTTVLTEAYDALTFAAIGGDNHDEANIVFPLHLPDSAENTTVITWASSDETTLVTDGSLNRPAQGDDNVEVELDATLAYGDGKRLKSFDLTVLAKRQYVTIDYNGTGNDVYMIEPMEGNPFSVTVNLGNATKDVYFVITNNNSTDAGSSPYVSSISSIDPSFSFVGTPTLSIVNSELINEGEVAQRGKLEITQFNAAAHGSNEIDPLAPMLSVYEGPAVKSSDVVETNQVFYTSSDTSNELNATCKKVVSADGKTLNIWVDNNMWGSCSKAYCVDQTMVDAVADRFLKDGSDNDIYNWVSSIYGEEWEQTGFPNMIDDDNNITILLYDIDDDNSTTGGVVGFFWAKDNFAASEYSGSNERVMFYMDAVMLATPDDGVNWSATDSWPSEIFSTLAHEYQHMIHFYQKQIKYNLGSSTDTWINEMCSMMAEDFVASKLMADGPRGVAYDDGTAGTSGNTGRLFRYNYYNFIALTDWLSGTAENELNILNSYSISYAFGAYLGRNYGGVELFRNIVDNNLTDETAISYAMDQMGHDENLSTLIPKWGAANLLSDSTAAPAKYRYNTGDYVDSTLNGITYSLGSINLFTYTEQPKIFTSIPIGYTPGTYKRSNLLLEVGSGVTGSLQKTVSLLDGYQLTVVIK